MRFSSAWLKIVDIRGTRRDSRFQRFPQVPFLEIRHAQDLWMVVGGRDLLAARRVRSECS
jgi:hypothetical protein